jgi:hypothetical protein
MYKYSCQPKHLYLSTSDAALKLITSGEIGGMSQISRFYINVAISVIVVGGQYSTWRYYPCLNSRFIQQQTEGGYEPCTAKDTIGETRLSVTTFQYCT